MSQSELNLLFQAVSELPVPAVGLLLAAVAILGGWLAGVRYRQPGFLLPSIGALGISIWMTLAAPYIPPPKPAVSEPRDYTAQANFRTRWLEDRILWGSPIGACGSNPDGLLQCPFTYGIMESHPEVSGEWQVMPVNAGLILMERRNVPQVSNPSVPAPIQAFVADMKQKGSDTLYFLGGPRSDPVQDGDRTCQYWEIGRAHV